MNPQKKKVYYCFKETNLHFASQLLPCYAWNFNRRIDFYDQIKNKIKTFLSVVITTETFCICFFTKIATNIKH
jgi:hypothetical protein